MVTARLPRSRTPPETVTAPVPKAPTWVTASVPVWTLTPPVKVLAPPRVRVPTEFLVSAVAPVRTEFSVPVSAVTWLRAMEPPARIPPLTVTALARVVVRVRRPVGPITSEPAPAPPSAIVTLPATVRTPV